MAPSYTNLSAFVFAFSRFAILSLILGDDGRADVGELSSAAILLGTGRGPRVATERVTIVQRTCLFIN